MTIPSVSVLSTGTLRNLRESGLTDITIDQAEISEPLREAGTQASSYNIPYFGVDGQRNGFSRTRHLNPAKGKGKYTQAAGTPTHVYVPPQLSVLAPGWAENTQYRLVITEGEKKALAGAQHGILTLGLGGVDNWVSRLKSIPVEFVKRTDHHKNDKVSVVVRIDDTRPVRTIEETVAKELTEIDWRGRDVLLAYDTPDSYRHEGVQGAAFHFGLWLYRQGAKVGMYYLPDNGGTKVGLDDWLMSDPDAAAMLLDPPDYTLFPPPPNPRQWLTKSFEKALGRNDQEVVAVGSLAALDARGERYRDERGYSYYFEKDTKRLHEFSWAERSLRNTTFGQVLTEIGLATADTQVMSRLADHYQTEGYVRFIEPERVIAKNNEAIYYQLTDGDMARVTAESIDVVDNGTDDVLFVARAVKPLNVTKLTDALQLPPQARWYDALESSKLKPMEPLDLDETKAYLTCLMYMSPWLWRWRGMQLPLEMAVAEAGSGKTYLYNLRMQILTGSQALFGMPNDLKDWYAQIGAAPALWVCDNLGKLDATFFHRFSDELARLITEPKPSVKMRKFYTEADMIEVPVRSAFAITTTKNGFTQPDITQRMAIFHLDAIPPAQRNPGWLHDQLRDGREAWIAEHLQYLQSFLGLAQQKWNETLVQKHRLVHFEQGVMLMGEALGFAEDLMDSIRYKLVHTVDQAVAETNPLIEALLVMKVELRGRGPLTLSDAVDWAQYDPEGRYSKLNQFNNSRQLGNAFRDNMAQIQRSTGLRLVLRNNQRFIVWDE